MFCKRLLDSGRGRSRWWLALVLSGLLLPAAAAAGPLPVLATTGMIGDVARNVGGDCVAVTNLMGPGVDPHLYQPSARDVLRFQSAELILYNGLELEGQLGGVLARLSRRKPTVAVAEQAVAAAPEALLTEPDSEAPDPHLWMDVGLWAATVPVIARAIVEQRPECADAVARRADAYRRQLEALDAWVSEAVASVPREQRVLVTAHDAFAYFGRAYDVEVAGIQGISTDAEAAVADIRGTAEMLVARAIPAVFIESTINPRTVEAVIAAAREQGQDVRIGGELYSDAMGPADAATGTYIGMLVANTVAIVDGLGGRVPALPAALADWTGRWGVDPARPRTVRDAGGQHG